MSKFKISTEKIWFGLLFIYLFVGYLSNDVFLPIRMQSLTLYLFLAYSVFAIIASGKIKLSPIFYWGLIFLALSLFAMIYSPEFSIFSGAYYALIVNFVLIFIFAQMTWTKERFDGAFLIYTLAAVVLIILLALTGNLIDNSESGRLGTELMGNSNHLATILMISSISAFWLLISSDKKMIKILMIFSLAIIYLGMFLSGGRKFVVIPIVFAFVLMLFKVDKNGRRHIIKSVLIIACILLVVYLLMMKVPFFYESIGYRFDGFFALFGDSNDVDGSTRVRLDMIEIGFKGWLENPIFGYGFDSFKFYNEAEFTGHFFYSHNNFIELLFNQGIIGFLAYYGFYIYLFFAAIGIRKSSVYKGFVIGLILALLIFEYFGVTYNVTSIQTMLFYCVFCLKSAGNSLEQSIAKGKS